MKIQVRVNRPPVGTKCAEHKNLPAKYAMQLEVFGHKFTRSSCELCICRHFNLQTFFSVEEGLELPKGLRHRR